MTCRPMFTTLAGSCALLMLAACGETDGGGGGEEAKAELRADYEKAADALLAKTGAPGQKAEMPAAGDPAVQAFEAQTSKAMTALGTDALPIDGFESYDALCGKTAQIVGAYVLAGTAGTAGPAQAQKMEANVKGHFDQLFTPLLFSAHCTAAHMPFLEGQAGDIDPSKAAALGQVRDGVFQQVNGLIQMAADPTLEEARRKRIMDLLAADASSFAVGLTQAQRREIDGAAGQLGAALPKDLQAQAAKLRTDLTAAPCGEICSAT